MQQLIDVGLYTAGNSIHSATIILHSFAVSAKAVIGLGTRECDMVMRLVAPVCLYVRRVRALTFESLELETAFLMCRYILRISRSNSYIEVIGSSQGHRSKNAMWTNATRRC